MRHCVELTAPSMEEKIESKTFNKIIPGRLKLSNKQKLHTLKIAIKTKFYSSKLTR